MDPTKTHGAFSWNELTTDDPGAAASFYSLLFGWTGGEPDAEMGDYRTLNLGDVPVAGIMPPPPDSPPMPPHWGCYVTVHDADQAAQRALALGGLVLVPPMDVPTVGRMAVLRDPQGAVFNVMQYSNDG